MMEDATKPMLSLDEIKKYQEMSKAIASFRKTLAPRKEAVVTGLKEGTFNIDEILELIEFDGKESSSYDIDVNVKDVNVPIAIRFSIKKVS